MNEFKNYADIDFKILNFIRINDPVHEDEILKKFPDEKYATKYRLNVLSTRKIGDLGFIKSNYIKTDTDSFYSLGTPTGTISITEKGLRLLCDYKCNQSEEEKKIFKSSFLYPFLVSIFTALITSCVANYCIKIFNLFDFI